jgi:hypothetical protein
LKIVKWSWRRDLNPQPADYKSAALPIELLQPITIDKWKLETTLKVSPSSRTLIKETSLHNANGTEFQYKNTLR